MSRSGVEQLRNEMRFKAVRRSVWHRKAWLWHKMAAGAVRV